MSSRGGGGTNSGRTGVKSKTKMKGKGKSKRNTPQRPAPKVQHETFISVHEGYSSVEKYVSNVNDVCSQIVDFLNDVNVAVHNIDICLVSSGCCGYLEYFRYENDGGDEEEVTGGERAAQIETTDDDVANKEGEVIDAATGRMERYGPWSFKQVHRKRKLLASDAGQVSELVKQTFQDACEANANQMVTFTNTMLSEVSCHMVRIPLMCCLACRAPAATYKGTRNQNMHFTSLQVVWHHGPEVNIAEGYSLGLQVFHRRGDENENQTSQSQATEAGSTGSPSDRRNAAASTLTSSSSDKTDKKKQGKTANDTNQENTLHSHDRPEVEDFLLWCHTQSKINSGRNVDYPRQGDLHQYVPDCRLISCSIARADFTRFLVIAFYSAAPNQSDRHGVVTAVAPADTDTGTDTGSSGGTIASNSRKGTSRRKKRMRSPVPIRAFKALFPGFGSPPGHTFTNSALLQLSFPAQAGRELFWAKFREATEHVTRAINNASDAARATTQFHLMVGPADEGVEVLVVHDGADAAQGKSTGFKKKGTKATTGSNSAAGHFLPRTLAEPRGSSTCTLL